MTDHTVLAKTIETEVAVPDFLDETALSLHLDFCDVNGFGNLKWADIVDSAGATVHLEGPIDLLSIRGRVRHAGAVTMSDYRVLLAKHTDNGIQVVGGQLMSGRATLLELSFTPLVSADMVTSVSPVVSASSLTVPARVVVSSPPAAVAHAGAASPATTVSSVAAGTYLGKKAAEKGSKDNAWANAMDLSAALEKKGKSAHLWEGESSNSPEVGDIVKHQQFGDCTVVKLNDEHIAMQKPDGRIVQLGLRILKFSPIDKDGARTLWDVSVKR